MTPQHLLQRSLFYEYFTGIQDFRKRPMSVVAALNKFSPIGAALPNRASKPEVK